MTQTPLGDLSLKENFGPDTKKEKPAALEPWGKANSGADGEKFFMFKQSEAAPKKQANPMTTPDMANLTNP